MASDEESVLLLDRRLRRLKRRGCMLLLVNDACGAAEMCEGLLGVPDRRSRLFFPTTATVPSILDRHRPCPIAPERLGVVDATTADRPRGAVLQTPASIDPTREWYSRVETLADLGTIGSLVETHLTRLAAHDAAPGTIRLCVESIDPLVGVLSREQLFRFLHALGERVKRYNGIAHFHTAGVDDRTVRTIEPLFDARIDVRTTDDGTAKQQWTLRDSRQQTDWLSVDIE